MSAAFWRKEKKGRVCHLCTCALAACIAPLISLLPSPYSFSSRRALADSRAMGPKAPLKRPASSAQKPVRKDMSRNTSAAVQTLVASLKRSFARHRNEADAAIMCGYLKGKHPFYGLKAPLRRQLTAEVLDAWKEAPALDEDLALSLLTALYSCKERELHYVGAEVCSGLMRRGFVGPSFLRVVKYGVTEKSWWDTVDVFAASSMSQYLLKCGDGAPSTEVLRQMDEWAVSDNLWLRRTAILCQMKLKGKTDLVRLDRYVRQNASHEDFFVRKAIGWALREYAKHDAQWVQKCLHKYQSQLSGLSVREARKHIGN